jgi:hypothetical protein
MASLCVGIESSKDNFLFSPISCFKIPSIPILSTKPLALSSAVSAFIN